MLLPRHFSIISIIPNDTYVLGIDWDYTDNQDFDDLFVDLDGTGQTEFEKLIADYLDIKVRILARK